MSPHTLIRLSPTLAGIAACLCSGTGLAQLPGADRPVGKPAKAVNASAPVMSLPAPEKLALDYNFAASEFPSASVLQLTKPAEPQAETKPTEAKAEPVKPAELASKPSLKVPKPMAGAGSVLPTKAQWLQDCAKHVAIIATSPIESDRVQSLHALSTMPNWQAYRPAYGALRQIALMEYNTKMRSQAIDMLATARSDHHLVADTLKLSALHDSNPAIRAKSTAVLHRLASAGPDSFVR